MLSQAFTTHRAASPAAGLLDMAGFAAEPLKMSNCLQVPDRIGYAMRIVIGPLGISSYLQLQARIADMVGFAIEPLGILNCLQVPAC